MSDVECKLQATRAERQPHSESSRDPPHVLISKPGCSHTYAAPRRQKSVRQSAHPPIDGEQSRADRTRVSLS